MADDPTQVNHTKDVEQAKEDCLDAGLSLDGACGAIRITNLVAWRLGYKLLGKKAGNRACLHADMSCVTEGEPGFADGYIIHLATGYGVDILGDAGGANTPAWQVETEEVIRNQRDWKEPLFDPAVMDGTPPDPPDPPDGDVDERLDNLEREMMLVQKELVAAQEKLVHLEAEAIADRARMEAINEAWQLADQQSVKKPLPEYVGRAPLFGGLVISTPKAP